MCGRLLTRFSPADSTSQPDRAAHLHRPSRSPANSDPRIRLPILPSFPPTYAPPNAPRRPPLARYEARPARRAEHALEYATRGGCLSLSSRRGKPSASARRLIDLHRSRVRSGRDTRATRGWWPDCPPPLSLIRVYLLPPAGPWSPAPQPVRLRPLGRTLPSRPTARELGRVMGATRPSA